MPIIVKGSSFTPTPEGQHQVVCVDVVEQYGVETAWGPKNKIKLVFQTRDLMDNGKPYLLSTSMNANLSDKGRLLPFLEAWRSKKFTREELLAFDVEKLLGANGLVQVVHAESGSQVYANIQTIMRLPQGTPPIVARDYVRAKDREGYVPPTPAQSQPDNSFEDWPDALPDDGDDTSLPF